MSGSWNKEETGGSAPGPVGALAFWLPVFDPLRQESCTIYRTSLLVYRFGGAIRGYLFLRGKSYNPLYILPARRGRLALTTLPPASHLVFRQN